MSKGLYCETDLDREEDRVIELRAKARKAGQPAQELDSSSDEEHETSAEVSASGQDAAGPGKPELVIRCVHCEPCKLKERVLEVIQICEVYIRPRPNPHNQKCERQNDAAGTRKNRSGLVLCVGCE